MQISLRQELNSALFGHEAVNLETSMTTKQNGHINLLLHVSQRKDLEGLVSGLVGVGQDITDQKRAEIEKSRIAQVLQTFIDTANAPIFGIDSHGLVNEWNNKTAAITGFIREEVLGRDLVQVHVS
jgi:PAS domain-containing protein